MEFIGMVRLPTVGLIIAAIFVLNSCASGAFTSGGQNEEKLLGRAGGQSFSNEESVTPVFISKYAFKAEFKVLKLDLCEGEAEIHAFSDASNQMMGEIPCLGNRVINLSQNSQLKSFVAPKELTKDLPLYGYFERTLARGGITYDPPVIETVAPVINDASKYINMRADEPITFTKQLPNNEILKASGRMLTTVEGVGSFAPDFYPERFNEVIHWKRTFTGFDKGTNFGEFGIFEEMEFRVQTRPFTIVQIIIRSKLRDLMGSPESLPEAEKEFGSRLGLNVVITLNLKHHETF